MTSSACAGKKILIVEDDKLLSSVLVAKFEEKGCVVTLAEDGEDGMNKYFEIKPDAAILDIMLPKKSGLQVLTEIVKRNPNDMTPILMLTNSNDPNNIAEAVTHKAVGYMVKSDQSLDEIVKVIEFKLCQTN